MRVLATLALLSGLAAAALAVDGASHGAEARKARQNAAVASLGKSGSTITSLAKSVPLPAMASMAAVAEETRAPMGWLRLCQTNPSECVLDLSEATSVTLDVGTWQRILDVNKTVNAAIKPMSDMDQWGVVEHWGLPTSGAGDCEDYALLKRQRLAEFGIPRRAMLMTVVIDETGGGHAILTIRTDRGDFILDNKRNAILSWEATGYRYVKRESQDVAGWVAMGETSATVTAAAQ